MPPFGPHDYKREDEIETLVSEYGEVESTMAQEGDMNVLTEAYLTGLALLTCIRVKSPEARQLFELIILNLRGVDYNVDDYADLVADVLTRRG